MKKTTPLTSLRANFSYGKYLLFLKFIAFPFLFFFEWMVRARRLAGLSGLGCWRLIKSVHTDLRIVRTCHLYDYVSRMYLTHFFKKKRD